MMGRKDKNTHTGRVPSTAAVFPAGLPQQLFVLGNEKNGDHSINQSLNQSINHSINQSLNQSINQPTNQNFHVTCKAASGANEGL